MTGREQRFAEGAAPFKRDLDEAKKQRTPRVPFDTQSSAEQRVSFSVSEPFVGEVVVPLPQNRLPQLKQFNQDLGGDRHARQGANRRSIAQALERVGSRRLIGVLRISAHNHSVLAFQDNSED